MIGRCVRCARLLLFRLPFGARRLGVLQRQLYLIGIEPFGPSAELSALKLLQQMPKLIILLAQPPALRNRCVALARQPGHQRA